MKKIIFVTGNKNKFNEANAILKGILTQKKHDLAEVQSLKLKKVVEHKVRQAYAIYRQPVVVEDVAFCVDAWNGFPGPFSKWLEQTISYTNLPKILTGKNRRASWQIVYGYYDGKTLKFFKGENKGTVAKKAKGENGFSFDVIFVPNGQTKTNAQLGAKYKNKNSARYLALTKLCKFLSVDSRVKPGNDRR